MAWPSRERLLLSMLETAVTAFEEQVSMCFHAHWQENLFRIQGPTGRCASVGAPPPCVGYSSPSAKSKLPAGGGGGGGSSGFCAAPACLAPLAEAWEALRDEAEALVAADPAARVAWGEVEPPDGDGRERADDGDADDDDRALLLDGGGGGGGHEEDMLWMVEEMNADELWEALANEGVSQKELGGYADTEALRDRLRTLLMTALLKPGEEDAKGSSANKK